MNVRLFSLLSVFLLSLILSLSFFPSPEAQIPTIMVKETLQPKKIDEEVKKEVITSIAELEKLKSPRDTMATFMNAMEEVKEHSETSDYYFKEAIKTLDLSEIKESVRLPAGKIAAERLINTLDRIAIIKLNKIPNYEDGPKWYLRKQTVIEGNKAFEVEVALEKSTDGAWRFSTQTVKGIDKLYSTVADQNVLSGVKEFKNWRTEIKDRMPSWMGEHFLMLKKGQWIGLVAIFIFSILVLSSIRIVLAFYAKKKIRLMNFLPIEGNGDFYKKTLPFGLLAFSLTWMGLFRFLELDLSTFAILWRAFYILIAISSVWSTLNIVDYVSLHFEKKAAESNNKFDDVLVPMLKKATKVMVVGLGAILIAHSLTFDVASILAGLGIGGVAIALAAKDTIANLFGSVTVILDRPFLIGDYVILDKLEGTIEEVGFRSTRIRTPHQSLVSLPNSVLANMAIDNYGMRGSRRFKTMLQMEYSTPTEKLEEYCERLRYLCKIHQYIDPSTAQIYVNEMTDKSVNILFNVFFNTKDGNIELTERHRVILEILKIADELGIKFATPPQLMIPKIEG